MLKIAINGFGRVGRAAFKIALAQKNIQIAAVNDLVDIENLAYLLKFDSVYGRFGKSVKVSGKNLIINGKKIPFYSVKNPAELPWKKHKIDVALECTGVFTKKNQVEKHLKAGAKKVLLSAPIKSKGVKTVIRGVNDQDVGSEKILANASCTTNCAAPIMHVLQQRFGVKKALLTTIHAATASQKPVDLAHSKDFRRGRSALNNIIPTTTGAAKATAKVLPELKEKFNGLAVRVPVVTGSLVDIVVLLSQSVSEKELKQVFIKKSKSRNLKGILQVTEEEMVSSDIVGTTGSAIVDLKSIKVVGGDLVKVMAWYDNEWGYAQRLVEMAVKM